MLSEDDFLKVTNVEDVDAFLSEHVFEHLTIDDAKIAAKNIYKFLKPGGYIRVAVPDGNFDNDNYQQVVQVGGPGPANHPAATHKVVYNYRSLSEVFESADFVVTLLEYCDDEKTFHYRYWNEEDGLIGRSYRFDTRNEGEQLGFVSLIIDAHKPMLIEKKTYKKTH